MKTTPIANESDVEVIRVPLKDRLYAAIVFYPTFVWNYLLGRTFKVRRWWDHIDPQVIVGAYPFKRDIEGLFQQGVRAVVNTCEEYKGPTLEYERLGIEQLHIPTTDFTHPRLRDIVLAVEFVQNHVTEGHTVYIHCKAGRARSATVALCWLVKYRGMSVDEAQATLINSRPHINPRLTERPVVRQFAKALETKTAEPKIQAIAEDPTNSQSTKLSPHE